MRFLYVMDAEWPSGGGGGGGAPSGPAGGVLTGTYPNPGAAASLATQAELDAAVALLAPLASPTFTGHPVGVTESAANNSTRLATTAYADGAVATETSARSTADNLLAPKASPTLTGTPASTTAAVDTNTTQIATTAFVVAQAGASTPAMDSTGAAGTSKRYARDDHVHPSDTTKITSGAAAIVNADVNAAAAIAQSKIANLTSDLALKAALASPALTGSPTAPTQTAADNSTKLATTAYVDAGDAVVTAACQPLDVDLTAVAALTPSNDDVLQRKSGAWTNRSIAQLAVDLGLADVSYVEFTATVTVIGTSESGGTPATTIVTAGAFTPNGTDAYWVEFFCSEIIAVAGVTTIVCLFDGSTSLGFIDVVGSTATTNWGGTLKRRLVPSNAAHAYSVRAYHTAGTNPTFQADIGGAGKYVPGYIRIYKAL